MRRTNAASVTYIVGRPALSSLRRPTVFVYSKKYVPHPLLADRGRRPFPDLSNPPVPFKTFEEIHAEVDAMYPDAPDEPWEKVRDAIQSGTSRPLFRDS